MRVLYVARNDGTDMRVSKECMSLVRRGYDVHFVGWRLYDGTGRPDPMPEVTKHLYASTGNMSLGVKLLGFPGFVCHMFDCVRRLRPDAVHAVNEELAFLAVLLSKRFKFRTVCDIFDSLELKFGQRKFPLNTAARGLSQFVHAKADALIVTDEARRQRLGTFSRKARVVANYPVDIGSETAYALPPSDGIVRIYVAGTLYSERGLQSILELVEARDDVRLVSAGWVFDDAARDFVAHPAVEYLGVVTPAESLRIAASCHAILALYEPSCENNVMASPNKIYDALCVGRPVIINRETLVAEWVREQDAGYIVAYNNVADLNAVVDALKAADVLEKARRLRSLFKHGYNWDVAECVLLSIYEVLNGEKAVYAAA